MAKAVIFDIRNATERDPLFLCTSQALYETSLLAYAARSPQLSSLSIAIIGSKGFEILASVLPTSELNFSFQKIITKLKQQLKIPPSSALYPHRGSFSHVLSEMLSRFEDRELVGVQTRLKELRLSIWTKSAKHKLTEEINAFLQRSHNYSSLAKTDLKIDVINLSLLASSSQPFEAAVFHDQVAWKVVNQEPDVLKYFKKWLETKRENWTLEAVDNHEWSVNVDIEDAALDLGRWQLLSNSTEQHDMNAIALFSSNDASCLQMTEYIRSDALPAYYLVGIGRYVTPSDNPANGISAEVNKSRFYALVDLLRKESSIAITQLLPPNKGRDLFVLIPSTDGEKFLMRHLVPRELILPFPNVSVIREDDVNEEELDAILKEQCRRKAIEAFESLPVLTELPIDDGSVLKAVAKKLQDEAFFALGAANKTVKPLKMRKANVKFVCQ